MSKDYIGCIDGRVLTVQQRKTEIVLSIGPEKARLSGEAAALLSTHLTLKPRSRVTSKPLHPTSDPASQSSDLEIDPDVTVPALIKAGLLATRDVVTLRHKGTTHRATITERGHFDVYGRIQEYPSGAARQVTKKAINGWSAWKVADGSSLHDLRCRFQWLREADRFPGEEHGYAISTIREKQRLAQEWVRYALDRGINPGKHNEQEVENFLGGNRYSGNTLTTYKTHLEQWFDRHHASP